MVGRQVFHFLKEGDKSVPKRSGDHEGLLNAQHNYRSIFEAHPKSTEPRQGDRCPFGHIVEDRLVGMKSRGVYETPGGTLLYAGLQELESITLDRRSMGLKDQMAQRYADMLYEGRWWTPEREALDAMASVLVRDVTGVVKLKLFKGSAWAVSRTSPLSLYREDLATFGEAATYDHADAEGFIKLFGLPIRAAAGRDGTGSSEADAVSELLKEVVGAGAV